MSNDSGPVATSAGFGLERLGLWTLKRPRVTLALIVLITPLLLFSASRLEFSSDIREIFRSESADFSRLHEVARQYPGTGRDILLVFQGTDLFRSDTLEGLRELHLELSLIEGVRYVLSMFSARNPPVGNETPKPLFPFDISEVEDFEEFKRAVQSHPLVADKLLSPDGELCLIIIALKDEDRDVGELRKMIGEMRSLAGDLLDMSKIDLAVTGLTAMRVEIIDTLRRDQRIFGAVGMTIGLLLCWIFFRKLSYVVIAGTPAAIAIIWLLGTMQIVGQEVNVLTNIVPILLMVIVFSNALHLLFGIRRNIQQGLEVDRAIASAVETIGPACVLTSATTTIALLSLTLVQHPFITGFGFIAAFGTAVAYIAIMVTVPPIAFFLLKKSDQPGQKTPHSDLIELFVGALPSGAARLVWNQPVAVALIGVALTLTTGTLYALNDIRYRYLDNLPTDNPAYRAIQTIDKKLAGPNRLDLLLQWPVGTKLAAQNTLNVVRDTHQILERETALKSVSSLHGVATWYYGSSRNQQDFFEFLANTRSPAVARVFAPESSSALLTANFADLDAAELIPVLDRLDRQLDVLRDRNKDVEFSITGIVPVSARASTEMIGQLNLSLLIAITMIIGLIGLAFKSLTAGLVSILPNLLPITVAGAGLYLSGVGLQFTSVVAFTVGFGIAVDNTIHVLNRYRLAKQAGVSVRDAIDKTIKMIGPVLTLATIVLVSGSLATFLSAMPVVRLYGYVSAGLLATALIGGMVFLPAILRVVEDQRARQTATL